MATVAFALLFPHCGAHAQDSAKRVLVLSSYNITYPGVVNVGRGIAERLKEKSPEQVELLNEFLDLARFPEPEHASRTAGYLAEKYAGRRPEVVITAGREASLFILKFRDVIAPDVPIVVCCLPAEEFAALGMVAQDYWRHQRARNFEGRWTLPSDFSPALEILSSVAGATDFDRQWVKLARQQIERSRMDVTTRSIWSELPYDTLIEEVSRLPRDTIVITLTYFADDQRWAICFSGRHQGRCKCGKCARLLALLDQFRLWPRGRILGFQ